MSVRSIKSFPYNKQLTGWHIFKRDGAILYGELRLENVSLSGHVSNNH